MELEEVVDPTCKDDCRLERKLEYGGSYAGASIMWVWTPMGSPPYVTKLTVRNVGVY